MAGARQSKASSRRERDAHDAAAQQRITLIAIGVLVAVAIIAAAGVVWGVILPPRAHLITVGDRSYNAGTVARISEFLLVGGTRSSDDAVTVAIKEIKREETLLQVGAAEVGEITADDMKQALRKRLGTVTDVSDEDFAKAYAAFLKGAPVDQPMFERMVRSQVIADRLAERFAAEIGDDGLQLHLLGVTSRDQNKLRTFREAVAGGADFFTTAVTQGLTQTAAAADLDWQLPPVTGPLHDSAHIADLQAGVTTEVLERPGAFQYDVYQLAERDEHRPYTDDQKKTLADQRVDDWVTEHQDRVTVTEDISVRERNWVLKEVASEAQRILERNSASAAGANLAGAPPGITVEQPGAK